MQRFQRNMNGVIANPNVVVIDGGSGGNSSFGGSVQNQSSSDNHLAATHVGQNK